MESCAAKEMPKYKCHKTVRALKIKDVNSLEDCSGAVITPENPGYGFFIVDQAYMNSHQVRPGGYYVVYEDGYKSYSPAKAFEEGYTLRD